MPHKEIKKLNDNDRGLVLEALNLLLLELQLEKNFKIECSNGVIAITCIEASDQGKFAKFKKALSVLSTDVQQNNALTMNCTGYFTLIKHIDFDNVEYLYTRSGKKLNEADQILFGTLPNEIKDRWHRFSPALRAHILQCKKDGFERVNLVESTLFGDSIRSPINLGVPSIPVCLPGTNDVYDLIDLLNIKSNILQCENPTTREPFYLFQISPETDVAANFREVLDSDEGKKSYELGLNKKAIKQAVLKDISTHLERLEVDMKSYFIFNASRKQEKINGLRYLEKFMQENPQSSFADSLKQVEIKYPQLREGYFSKIARSFDAFLREEKDLNENSAVILPKLQQ